jgi:hypothetical protein
MNQVKIISLKVIIRILKNRVIFLLSPFFHFNTSIYQIVVNLNFSLQFNFFLFSWIVL